VKKYKKCLKRTDIVSKNAAFFFKLSSCLKKRENLSSFIDGLFNNQYQVRPMYDVPKECQCPWRNVAKYNIEAIDKLAFEKAPRESQGNKNLTFGAWGTL